MDFTWQLHYEECAEGGNGSITLQHLYFFKGTIIIFTLTQAEKSRICITIPSISTKINSEIK